MFLSEAYFTYLIDQMAHIASTVFLFSCTSFLSLCLCQNYRAGHYAVACDIYSKYLLGGGSNFAALEEDPELAANVLAAFTAAGQLQQANAIIQKVTTDNLHMAEDIYSLQHHSHHICCSSDCLFSSSFIESLSPFFFLSS